MTKQPTPPAPIREQDQDKDQEKDQDKEQETQFQNPRGLETLFPEIPSVEIEGRVYNIRRLGLNDAMAGLRVFAAGSGGIMRLGAQNLSDPTNLAMAIMAAIPYAENHVKDFLAGILMYADTDKEGNPKRDKSGNIITKRVTMDEITNPDLFPLGSFVNIIEALGKHPDLGAFVNNVKKLGNSPLWDQIKQSAGTEPSKS